MNCKPGESREIGGSMFQVIMYTDGSAIPQNEHKPGGYCAILRYGDHSKTVSGARLGTTSQVMELTALVEGLKALKTPCEVLVHTDSQYLVNGLTGRYSLSRNLEVWKELKSVIADGGHVIYFKKVAAHTGVALNEECDRIAKAEIQHCLESWLRARPKEA